MVNQPHQPPQKFPVPSGKLVLPAPPEQEPDGQTYTSPTHPVPLIRRAPSPVLHGLLPPSRSFWPQAPASRVLGLAIALVFAALIALVALGANTLLSPTLFHSTQMQSTGQTATSAPPTTPTLTSAGSLTVQITSISDSVENGTTAQVQVHTSKPGVKVTLQVTYRGSPFSSTSSSQTTDSNGQATIGWSVNISSFSNKTHATVTVVATDQNGQQATSDPVTVTITNPHQEDNNN